MLGVIALEDGVEHSIELAGTASHDDDASLGWSRFRDRVLMEGALGPELHCFLEGAMDNSNVFSRTKRPIG